MTSSEEFSELLRTHGDAAWRMALHLTEGKETEAADLVQNAFIRIWRRWAWQKPNHFKSWLYKILHNLYIDECRKRSRRPTSSLDAERSTGDEGDTWADHLADPALPPHREAEQRETQAQVRRALQSLPIEFRIPVMLCDMEGMPYEEIARVVSCPVGTVRSRISRGRQQLRRALGSLEVLS